MRKFNCVFARLIGLCLLTVLALNVNAQFDSTTGFTKYVVDKSKKKSTVKSQEQQTASAMLLPPPEGCVINGSTTVTGGSTYTYFLSCGDGTMADYWGVTGGTIIEGYSDEVTIQWCSNSCGSGAVRAYTNAAGLIATKNVTISSPPALSGGTISNPTQTINYNASAQINASVATGGSCGGAYSYQWQKSSIIDGTYTDIAGATGQNYQTANLTATTYFRRKVTCGTTAYTTNTATISVAGALYGGYVTNPNQTIQPNTVPAQINATAATGGNCGGSYSYQWQSAITGGNYTNIPGATGQNYQPGALSVTTHFNRVTTCNGEVAYLETTGMVTVIQPLNGGCITSGNQQVLFGNLPSTITATPASEGNCNGNYSYQWQSSTDNIYFSNIPGATSQNLSFSTPLSQTTWFQRKTTCGSEVKYTGSVKVTMTSTITYYNVEKSGTFTRNNCGAGNTGSNVIYTVPANTYSSTVSQAAADQLAQDDVNANGQTYANTNGTCTPTSPVSITLRNIFSGSSYPGSITVRFKQGGTTIQTNSFPSTQSGSTVISLSPGTYQMEFTMPSGFSTYYIAYDKNNPYEFWDNGGNGLVLTSSNVTFSSGTSYTVTASNAIP